MTRPCSFQGGAQDLTASLAQEEVEVLIGNAGLVFMEKAGANKQGSVLGVPRRGPVVAVQHIELHVSQARVPELYLAFGLQGQTVSKPKRGAVGEVHPLQGCAKAQEALDRPHSGGVFCRLRVQHKVGPPVS